jgi:hypothetical protein
MKKVITLMFVCINLIVTAQNNENQFPEYFFGTYKGDLEIKAV